MFKRMGASTKAIGDEAEAQALVYLKSRGLVLVQAHYRVARGPSAHGGEIDLIMREPASGTLVFVEVRARRSAAQGGAAATIGATKQRRLVFAARHYLLRLASPPPCRFDVVAIDGQHITWIQAAFDAGL